MSDYLSSLFWPSAYSDYSIWTFVVEVSIGIGITHFFRSIILEYRWIQQPFFRIIIYIIPASIVMTLLSMSGLAIFGLIGFLFNPGDIHKTVISEIPQNIFLIFYQTTVINFLWYFIWSLIYFVYHAFENLQLAKIEKIRIEGKYKEIELQQLRSQLNPHFLFNALNSVRALIDENPIKARESITQLSNILRTALNVQSVRTIKLEQELQIVRDYLSLEKVRFDHRLEYSIEASDDSLKYEVPPMLIQTLVENSIKHGIGQLRQGGKITVAAKKIYNLLEVTIINTGRMKDNYIQSAGYGITNTIERLKLIYGENANFRIHNTSNNTVEAIITISF